MPKRLPHLEDSKESEGSAPDEMLGQAGAVFSDCRDYRYRLWRSWDPTRPRVFFVLFNPSTADGQKDDPTLRRCIGFARAWGFGGLLIGNLFPRISPNPRLLLQCSAVQGLGNSLHLHAMQQQSELVVCAWGNGPLLRRLGGLPDLAPFRTDSLHCLRLTAEGIPGHPLYLPAGRRPFPLPEDTLRSQRTTESGSE